jgi:hypothetical protein
VDSDELVALIGGLENVEVVVASEKSGAPESAWGDVFFSVRRQKMPFATIVMSDYPGFDEASELDREGVFRLNLAIGRDELRPRLGTTAAADPTSLDVLMPHPVYGSHGWISVLNPVNTADEVRRLVDFAHRRAAATKA